MLKKQSFKSVIISVHSLGVMEVGILGVLGQGGVDVPLGLGTGSSSGALLGGGQCSLRDSRDRPRAQELGQSLWHPQAPGGH